MISKICKICLPFCYLKVLPVNGHLLRTIVFLTRMVEKLSCWKLADAAIHFPYYNDPEVSLQIQAAHTKNTHIVCFMCHLDIFIESVKCSRLLEGLRKSASKRGFLNQQGITISLISISNMSMNCRCGSRLRL
jgi:hypothetical protein